MEKLKMSHRHHQHHRRQFHGHNLLQDSSNAQAQAEQQDVKRQVATLVSVVYKTATPTFDGPVGGYTTIIPSIQAPTFQITPTPVQASQAVTSATQQQSSLAASTTVLSSVPAVSSASTIAASISSALIGSSVNSIQTSSTIQATVLAPSSSSILISIQTTSPAFSPLSTSAPVAVSSASQASSSDSATVSKQESKGLTGGAKAGIAIGVILGLVVIVGLIAFCCLRRKKQRQKAHDRSEDEKNPFGDNAATPAPPRTSLPPQIGLRPLMESHPEMATQAKDNNPLSFAGRSAAISRQDAEKGPTDRPNPFEEQVEASGSTPTDDHLMLSKQEIPAPLRIRTPTPEAVAHTGLLAGASATIAQRHNTPKPLDIKRAISPIPAAPSPAGTEFSITSISQGSMANNLPSNNVHRIQLDFKPSMEDELELRAGQLVRLLHEYDDGWALCIRLDRSQQGVAPRSCLSTRPVKPRVKPSSLNPSSTGNRGAQQQRQSPPPSKLGSSSVSDRGQGSESPTPAPRGNKSTSPGPNSGGPQQEKSTQLGNNVQSNSVEDLSEKKSSSAEVAHLGVQSVEQTSQEIQVTVPSTSQSPSPPRAMQRKPVPGQVV